MFPFELVRLTDDENEVRVTVLSPMGDDLWEAEISVASLFVKGATLLVLYDSRLQAWKEALVSLSQGRNIDWMSESNGPTVTIELEGENGCPDVVVADESISMVTVRIPVALEDGWIAENQERLRRFMEEL
ncbi:DUF5959 family protein [Streptomyces sp. NPDC004327]|uniref:DUF5959 family protein n=1 Tax=Streptomyces sp. NPDC004327 TaxID=3364699 RepID=UPI00369F1938